MKFRFAPAALSLLTGFGAFAATTNTLSDAEIQGRQLAQHLLEQQPAEDSTNTGVLKIKNAKGKTSDIPIKFVVIITATNWLSVYEGIETNPGAGDKLRIIHRVSLPNKYAAVHVCGMGLTFSALDDWDVRPFSDEGEMTMPFSQSDFWAVDLGLEFFHWPGQTILKHELRRSRACMVLESVNPNPSTDGYSRVVSWIDNETLGIIHAEAYDAKGKLLKEFDPKSFKKVNGQWQLQEMEIRNDQTGSRTRLEFDVKKE
jgi:outer membrane lipoprotein-sorting protein